MSSRGRTPTVFIVDDDESVRTGLRLLMQAEGFTVRSFESSERFLEEVTDVPSACVLLDLDLPRISGLEVQRRLNERGIRMPVIALSACDDDATRHEARHLGARFLFRKPVDDRTLVDAIDWVVNPENGAGGQ